MYFYLDFHGAVKLGSGFFSSWSHTEEEHFCTEAFTLKELNLTIGNTQRDIAAEDSNTISNIMFFN